MLIAYTRLLRNGLRCTFALSRREVYVAQFEKNATTPSKIRRIELKPENEDALQHLYEVLENNHFTRESRLLAHALDTTKSWNSDNAIEARISYGRDYTPEQAHDEIVEREHSRWLKQCAWEAEAKARRLART